VTFRILCEYSVFEDYQVEAQGTKGSITADFKAKGKRLIETKNVEKGQIVKVKIKGLNNTQDKGQNK